MLQQSAVTAEIKACSGENWLTVGIPCVLSTAGDLGRRLIST